MLSFLLFFFYQPEASVTFVLCRQVEALSRGDRSRPSPAVSQQTGQSLVSKLLGRQVKAWSRQVRSTGLGLNKSRPCTGAGRSLARVQGSVLRSSSVDCLFACMICWIIIFLAVEGISVCAVSFSGAGRSLAREQWQCRTKPCTGMLAVQDEALHRSGGRQISAHIGPIGRICDGCGTNRFPAPAGWRL